MNINLNKLFPQFEDTVRSQGILLAARNFSKRFFVFKKELFMGKGNLFLDFYCVRSEGTLR